MPVTWPRFRRRQVSGSSDECTAVPDGEPSAALEARRLEEARERWASWYGGQANVLAPGVDCPLACPCCGHPTLGERGGGERCRECGWYDDGQDDHDSDVVRGGPNGCLSLDSARLRYVERGGSPLPREPGPDPA